MKNDMKLKTDCKSCREHLADLLLDESYAAAHPGMAAHMAVCPACSAELAGLKSTFALLDHWSAPEPSPFFDSKLRARLREAEASEPAGLWERMRSFLLFSTGRSLRPAMAGALALAMVAGGGGVLLGVHQQSPTVAASPAVNDLKILDNNAQALQQMDQLLDASGDDNSAPPTT
jgi:anti-sigma factor RsiW